MTSVSLWFLIPLTCAALFGILINSYILLVVLFSRQHTSVNNLLLLHLGTLNLCLGATFLAFSAPGLAHDSWLSHGILCKLHGFLFTILHPLVLWTVCGLNADRYYAIAAPLHYGHLVNPRKVFLCLGIGWIISLCFTIFPFVHVAPFAFNRGLGACVPNFQSGRTTLWYSAAFTAFTLLLPITLIICCNVKILMIARYHRHRIASAIYEVTLSAQVTITHQRNPFFVPTVTAPGSGGPKLRSRSPVSTVLQLLGSFVLLYVPYYSIILWESCITFLESDSLDSDAHIAFYQFVLALLTLAPTVNGILYGVKNKSLRKTFQNYWRKKLTKSEVNQEIQARTPSTCGSRRQSLTPLGFFARPNNERRLSETSFLPSSNGRKDDSMAASQKIKRIASEIAWKPQNPINLSLPNSGSSSPHVCKTDNLKCNFDVDLNDIQLNKKGLGKDASKQNRTFLHKLFGVDGNKAPKILITRALSEDDYSKNAREASNHSLFVNHSLSKWYHHSDYNLLRDQASRKSQRNSESYELSGAPLEHIDDDSDSDNNSEHTTDSDNSGGLYMNLDSFDTLRTQSYDIDMQDLVGSWQLEAIEAEFANSSYGEDVEMPQKLANYSESIRIENSQLTLQGKDFKELIATDHHEVVP